MCEEENAQMWVNEGEEGVCVGKGEEDGVCVGE